MQAPVAGLFLKRNVFLAFIVQLCIVSVVGWQAISSMLAWLTSSILLLMFHAALRRPSWHLNLIATASTAKRSSRPDWGWWAGEQPEGVTYFGYVAMFSESATRSPPEGFRSLLEDCRKRLAKLIRRRCRYLLGWQRDLAAALRFEWFQWCEKFQQRRARRMVRGVKNGRRRLIPWGRKQRRVGSKVTREPCLEDGDVYL